MKIVLINGSPKVKGSASGVLLADLKRCLAGQGEVTEIALRTGTVPADVRQAMENAGAWVFVFPLYVDGVPGHLLSCLMELERAPRPAGEVNVYGIVNCGFFEGGQAEYALDVLKNWCTRLGLLWGGGIGVGGGGAIAMLPAAEAGHGPKAPIDKALKALAGNILHGKAQGNVYVSVAMPRFLYRLAAQMGWRKLIRANGGKWADLGKRPE